MQGFKDVVGYEDHFMINEEGQVYSKRTNRLLKLVDNHCGYQMLNTRLGGRCGKAYSLRVHRLVAEAFIPNPDNKPQVNHIDGDKCNNRVSNLGWVTAKENSRHAWDSGLQVSIKGSSQSQSKLTEGIVQYAREVYKPYDKTFGIRALARQFGVAHSVLGNAINGLKWTHC
jgi:hypothetical protein